MANLKFTEKELVRLGCSEDEINVVMTYQKKLPILSMTDDNSDLFHVDARVLHELLNVKQQFSRWIGSNIDRLGLTENIDYNIVFMKGKESVSFKDYAYLSPQKLSALGVRKDYLLTENAAKYIAMSSGSSNHVDSELKETSKLVRDYFILMEKIVKKNKEWWAIRNEERKNYKPLCDALSECIHKQCGRYGDKYDFTREANVLNIIVTGCKAAEIRAYLMVTKKELTRDSLEKDYNEKLGFLQDQDILLCGMGMSLIDRIKMLIQMFDIKYPDAKPLQDYLTREDLLKARQTMIDEIC